MEREFLEELRERDPQGYSRFLEERKRNQEKRKIINDLRENKISLEQAKSLLRPFIQKELDLERLKDNVDTQIQMIERQIQELKERIEFLKKAKNDPNLFIEEQIKRELGIR